jgi:hypothetical protein
MLNIESAEKTMLRLDCDASLFVLQLTIHSVAISEKRIRSYIGLSGGYRNARFVRNVRFVMMLSQSCCLVIILHLRTKNLIRALLSLADIAASYRSHHKSGHFQNPKFLSIRVGPVLDGRTRIGRRAHASTKPSLVYL